MNIKCFLIEPNGIEWRWYRRFTFGSDGVCADSPHQSGHDAQLPAPDGPLHENISAYNTPIKHFPTHCTCGYEFQDGDEKQIFSLGQYVCDEKPGELYNIREAPPGAIWRATWYEDIKSLCGVDGRAYIIQTPGGSWHIDGTASNCNLPGVEHKCWCRHGEAPNFTVDKTGVTCSAGAGSILFPNYHGFLRDGYLVDC